jgi:hypothetical protein
MGNLISENCKQCSLCLDFTKKFHSTEIINIKSHNPKTSKNESLELNNVVNIKIESNEDALDILNDTHWNLLDENFNEYSISFKNNNTKITSELNQSTLDISGIDDYNPYRSSANITSKKIIFSQNFSSGTMYTENPKLINNLRNTEYFYEIIKTHKQRRILKLKNKHECIEFLEIISDVDLYNFWISNNSEINNINMQEKYKYEIDGKYGVYEIIKYINLEKKYITHQIKFNNPIIKNTQIFEYEIIKSENIFKPSIFKLIDRTNSYTFNSPVAVPGRPLRDMNNKYILCNITHEIKRYNTENYFDNKLINRLYIDIKKIKDKKKFVDKWLKIAQLENSSVNSFDQVIEELKIFDAPDHIIKTAKKARLDEIKHSQYALIFANIAYSIITSNKLSDMNYFKLEPLKGKYILRDLDTFLYHNYIDGCIGETQSSKDLETEAYKYLDEGLPELHDILMEISRDEKTHGDLAYEIKHYFSK